jgi:D-aminopeptidase
MKRLIALIILGLAFQLHAQKLRPRAYGLSFGILKTGPLNSITDVPGVSVGHFTKVEGDNVRTGVTAILPHQGNLFKEKLPAAIYIGNGFGKLMGYSQVKELGTLETPIILTNTLSVPMAAQGLMEYSLAQNPTIRSVNPVVGETNDGRLNDIRGFHIQPKDVFRAIENANTNRVEEGNVGAGTGTICFGFKGGIGSASRVLPSSLGGYTLGVLVQTNFGGVLQIEGKQIGKELGKYAFKDAILQDVDGSCMMVLITDAPLDARNLERLAKRAMMGLAKTGGIASNGSGDYVIAVSTATKIISDSNETYSPTLLKNQELSPLFLATIEATEEAIINSLFAAQTTTSNGATVQELPVKEVLKLLKH